jgi:hypothetical protein
MLRVVVAVWLVILGPTPARAASWFDADHQALPCRPTIACTADIVSPGSFELEVGYLFRKFRDAEIQHSVPFLAKLTLAEWVQLQVGGNGPTFANAPVPTHYIDDIVTGLVFHLADQAKYIPSFSWSLELSSPLAAAAGYTPTYDFLSTADFTFGLTILPIDLWNTAGELRRLPHQR